MIGAELVWMRLWLHAEKVNEVRFLETIGKLVHLRNLAWKGDLTLSWDLLYRFPGKLVLWDRTYSGMDQNNTILIRLIPCRMPRYP